MDNKENRNEQIKSLQKKIILFLSAVNYTSWHILKRNIYNLCENEAEGISNNLEYSVLYPLLRIGIIETARNPETGKLVYCLGADSAIQVSDDKCLNITIKDFSCKLLDKNNVGETPIISRDSSLVLLRKIPSLEDVISHWVKIDIEMHYLYNRFEKNHFKAVLNTTEPNLYANSDHFYSEKYIRTREGNLYLLPSIDDNIDAVNIALCYLRIISRNPIFFYDPNAKNVTCWGFNSIIPFVLCRSLLLCDPMILVNGGLHQKTIVINNISNNYIREIRRIFGEYAVRGKYE